MADQKRTGSVTLTVNATLESADSSAPKTVVYAFSSGGQLLGRAPVGPKGAATLTFASRKEAASVRVLVGPDIAQETPSVDEVIRRGAYEQHVRIDPESMSSSVNVSVIPEIWKCWILGLCTVRGTLLKRVLTGGISVDLPVCSATVEVYEVDPIYILIPKLPDSVIDKIRDIVVGPNPPDPIGPVEVEIPRVPSIPIPPPAPEPFSASLNNSVFAGEALLKANLASAASVRTRTQSTSLGGVSEQLKFQALNASAQEFRQVLIDNPYIIRPLLCRFFPHLVTMQLVATTTTNECGHFQTLFFRGCSNADQPDLYFKAKQRIFSFFEATIYAPTPIACYTHWNYQCGTEVTLHTTHPLARTCAPCAPIVAPNNWVLVMAVGNLPLSRIRGTASTLQASTNATNRGLTDGDAPFGGMLRFRIEFDNSLRDTLDVKYYRASYRKVGTAAFVPMTGECHRHFTHEIGGDLVLEAYSLGPRVVGSTANLFEIPPGLPPIGQWSYPDLTEDLTSAKFLTLDLAPLSGPGVAWPEHGKYEVRVELFDSVGNAVDINAKGIKYRVPTSTDLSGTIYTEDAAALGLISGNSFIMTVHVDNSLCSASTDAPVIGGTAADPCCGVLEYGSGDSVTLAWHAVHPNQFATYGFGIVRGVQPVFSQGGGVAGGSFSTTQTVDMLLSTNPFPGCDPDGCSVAGFSENLYVAGTATDGWGRLSWTDASAVRAFVLAPEPGQ